MLINKNNLIILLYLYILKKMRPRETSYGLSTSMKYKIIQVNNVTKDDSKKKDYLENLEEYAASNLPKKEPDSFETIHNIPLHSLKPDTSKRIYSGKGKPLKFHEKASIVRLNQSDISEINTSQKSVNFLNFMAMFDENEIDQIDIEQLLGIDIQKYDTLKGKLGRILEYVKSTNGDGKNEAIAEIKDKMSQIDNNVQNINNISSNIGNIDKIIYGENETKVIFQMK